MLGDAGDHLEGVGGQGCRSSAAIFKGKGAEAVIWQKPDSTVWRDVVRRRPSFVYRDIC